MAEKRIQFSNIVQNQLPAYTKTEFPLVSDFLKQYYLGQEFTNGVANAEVKKYSGNIIYVDNRPSITRSTNQKEDIKVILQF